MSTTTLTIGTEASNAHESNSSVNITRKWNTSVHGQAHKWVLSALICQDKDNSGETYIFEDHFYQGACYALTNDKFVFAGPAAATKMRKTIMEGYKELDFLDSKIQVMSFIEIKRGEEDTFVDLLKEARDDNIVLSNYDWISYGVFNNGTVIEPTVLTALAENGYVSLI